MHDRRSIQTFISLLLALSLSCGAERPLVERHEHGDWQPDSFRVSSLGGQFAAPRVAFVLRLEGDAGRRLTVEGTIEINPQASLVGGRWLEERGSTVRSGVLSSASIDYFGGQGDRPSLRGQLTLSNDKTHLYRINLPRTRLGTDR